MSKLSTAPVKFGLSYAGGKLISVQLRGDDRIVQHLRANNAFEPETLDWYCTTISKMTTPVVLDIGAYSGLFSLLAHKLGGLAHAFDPLPTNRVQMEHNMSLNEVRFAGLHTVAVGDKDVQKVRVGYNPSVHLTAGASVLRKSGPGVNVPMITIDRMFANYDKIDFIKIDVERFERAVLVGAQATIAKHKPHMIVEVLDDDAKTAVLALLPDYDYQMVDVRNLLLTPR